MVSKEIRQKIIELKEIIDLWYKFYNLIKEAYDSKTASKLQEEEFLTLKTTLARKQQTLAGISSLRLMNILSQATTLADMLKTSDIQARKFYADWHEAYLGLNELLGRMESGKLETETIRPGYRQDKKRPGCLYHFILLIIFIALAFYAFRRYDARYDLRSKIKVWVERVKPAPGEPEKTDKGGKIK